MPLPSNPPATPRPASPPATLRFIEDGLLAAMANNPRFTQEFPFLRSMATASGGRRGGCGRCGANRQKRASVAQVIKRMIAGMDSGRKARLKALLNAKAVRVIYTDTGGRRVELTF